MKLRAVVRNVTGATKHFVGGMISGVPVATSELNPPAYVEIEGSEAGYFLKHFDEFNECFADTWHPTLAAAKAQANFEFQMQEGDWKEASSI